MTTSNQHNFQGNIKSELEFRIWFKAEFGVDYQEALKYVEDMKAESERRWQQSLTKNSELNNKDK